MKRLTRRVCSHTEPPPPEGTGKKYDICGRCATPWRQRKQYSSGSAGNHLFVAPERNRTLHYKDGQKKFPMPNFPLFRLFAREFGRLQVA